MIQAFGRLYCIGTIPGQEEGATWIRAALLARKGPTNDGRKDNGGEKKSFFKLKKKKKKKKNLTTKI